MEFKDFLSLLWQKKGVVFSITLFFLAVATALTLVIPLKHGASSRILIVQDFPEGTSSYAITQSNQHLSKLLARVVDSSAFFRDVLDSGYNINTSYFSPTGDSQEMIKEWRNTVEARAVNDGEGIIEIDVYHTERFQLEQISGAVIATLKNNHVEYHGLKDTLSLKIIDEPIISNFPVRPNIFHVFSLALILGLISSGSYVYLFSDTRPQNPRPTHPQGYGYRENGYKRYIETDAQPRRSAGNNSLDNNGSIPIKQEDPEEFLGHKNFYTQESDCFDQGHVNDRFDQGSQNIPDKEMDPEEVEKRGDIRNVFR